LTYTSLIIKKIAPQSNFSTVKLPNIDDSFKKIIIVGEDTPVLRNEAGVTTIGIYDFLLDENALEL
jgi:hypothetical protein